MTSKFDGMVDGILKLPEPHLDELREKVKQHVRELIDAKKPFGIMTVTKLMSVAKPAIEHWYNGTHPRGLALLHAELIKSRGPGARVSMMFKRYRPPSAAGAPMTSADYEYLHEWLHQELLMDMAYRFIPETVR